MQLSSNLISVGARGSPLSKAQVKEVLFELKKYHPSIDFEIKYIHTAGDKDLKTSLRKMEKTDFFTKEIDHALLQEICRIGIHSAKDLPEPIPNGLSLICLTKGIDPSDSLIMKQDVSLQTLPQGAKVATSSIRREEVVKKLRSDFTFCDVRGTIEQRLELLNSGEVEAVVIAEAALIRLGLTHLNRVQLSGPTSIGQGQLAIVAKSTDHEMQQLFSCMDIRKQKK